MWLTMSRLQSEVLPCASALHSSLSLVRCLCHAQRSNWTQGPSEVVGYRAERHSLDGSLVRRVSVLYPIHIPLFTSFYTSHWCRCSTTLPFILVRNNASVAYHGRFIRNLQAIVPWHPTFSLDGGFSRTHLKNIFVKLDHQIPR